MIFSVNLGAFVSRGATLGGLLCLGSTIFRIRTKTATLSTNEETGSRKNRAESCAQEDQVASSRERQAARGPAKAS